MKLYKGKQSCKISIAFCLSHCRLCARWTLFSENLWDTGHIKFDNLQMYDKFVLSVYKSLSIQTNKQTKQLHHIYSEPASMECEIMADTASVRQMTLSSWCLISTSFIFRHAKNLSSSAGVTIVLSVSFWRDQLLSCDVPSL